MKKIVLILGVLFALLFPFILDGMYGSGCFAGWKNSFSGDTWFSFIGSYFPATIMGLLTLYQASIIQEQDARYRKLLNRHRFIPEGHAHVYRYNKDSYAIGQYDVNEIERMLVRSEKKHLFEEWESGYIIECDIYNASSMEMNQIEIKKIEWEINKQSMYQQKNTERMAAVVVRISHSKQRVVIFWLFDEKEKAGEEIAQCMNNEFRADNRFEASVINIVLQILDDDEKCNVEMRYCLQSLSDTYEMSSIEENYDVS